MRELRAGGGAGLDCGPALGEERHIVVAGVEAVVTGGSNSRQCRVDVAFRLCAVEPEQVIRLGVIERFEGGDDVGDGVPGEPGVICRRENIVDRRRDVVDAPQPRSVAPPAASSGCGSDGLSLRHVAAAGGHEQDEEPRRQSFHALMMGVRRAVGKHGGRIRWLGSSVARSLGCSGFAQFALVDSVVHIRAVGSWRRTTELPSCRATAVAELSGPKVRSEHRATGTEFCERMG